MLRISRSIVPQCIPDIQASLIIRFKRVVGGAFFMSKKPFKFDDQAAEISFDIRQPKRKADDMPSVLIDKVLELVFHQMHLLG